MHAMHQHRKQEKSCFACCFQLACVLLPDADEDDTEDEEDDVDLLASGDAENDSDADLDALLEDANRLIGRPSSSGRKRAKTGRSQQVSRGNQDSDVEEEEGGADYMYADFWGSSKSWNTGRQRGTKGAVAWAGLWFVRQWVCIKCTQCKYTQVLACSGCQRMQQHNHA